MTRNAYVYSIETHGNTSLCDSFRSDGQIHDVFENRAQNYPPGQYILVVQYGHDIEPLVSLFTVKSAEVVVQHGL